MLAFGEITITEVFDGVSVSSVDVWFYPSTSQTHLVGGSWTTNAPQARDGIWIWSKTITTLSDGTKKESSPTCVTGAKGAVGKSIDKLEEEYYLSSSKITQTGGSWVKTPPVWVFGKYMWTRVKITYKNPTSVEYSIPICDSSWEAANGFKEELNGLITQNQTAISGVSSKVNEVEKSITNKVWKDDITTEINTYDSSTVQTIRNNVAENKTEIGKITNTVSDVQSTLKTKADGSTVQTLTERVAKAEQDASGFKQTVEQNYLNKHDLKLSARNLLRNSKTLIYKNYHLSNNQTNTLLAIDENGLYLTDELNNLLSLN